MLKKSLASLLILSLVGCQSAQVSRKVASDESRDGFASRFQEIMKGDDFEAMFQRALGAGYAFNDDPYFHGYKRVTPPRGQFPKEFSDVILLMKVTHQSKGVQEVTLVTTTESRAKEHKTLSVAKIKFSAEQGDVINRLNWEEGVSGLAASTLRTLQRDKKDVDVSKNSKDAGCLAFSIVFAAIVGLTGYAIFSKPEVVVISNAREDAYLILFLLPLILAGAIGGSLLGKSLCEGSSIYH